MVRYQGEQAHRSQSLGLLRMMTSNILSSWLQWWPRVSPSMMSFWKMRSGPSRFVGFCLLLFLPACLPACLPLFLSFVLSCSFYFLIIYRSFLLSYYFSLAFWLVQMMNWQHLTATVVTEGCRLGVNWLLGFLGSCSADWSLEFA